MLLISVSTDAISLYFWYVDEVACYLTADFGVDKVAIYHWYWYLWISYLLLILMLLISVSTDKISLYFWYVDEVACYLTADFGIDKVLIIYWWCW